MPDTPLVLFTTRFPYGRGETFLESEIGHLAERFARVTIVPTLAEGPARPVPANVAIEHGWARQRAHGARRVAAGLAAVVAPEVRREVLRHVSGRAVPHAFLRAGAFEADVRTLSAWLAAEGPRLGLDRPGAVAYAYWLGRQALVLGRARARWPGLRVIARAHHSDLYETVHASTYLPFLAQQIRGLDRLWTVSEHGRAHVATKWPDLADVAAVARLGVHDPGFDCRPSADGTFRVVSCSSLIPGKRVDLLIASLRALTEALGGRPVAWEHFGDGPERARLEALAASTLLTDVRWRFRGHVPNREVIAHYGAAPVDAFVNLSVSEGVPVSIMEAFAAGIPAVATAVGGTPEIVGEGGGILVSSAATPAEVAAALARLASDAETHAAYRAAAKRTWAERFDAARNYRSFAAGLAAMAVA